MRYTVLGKTGLEISCLGFGGIPIQRSDPESVKTLMTALSENGINYIDTARGYTVSEEYIGMALGEGLRDKFILATKSMSRTADAMRRDIETSLSNLRTDYIDLYQIHNPNIAQLKEVCSPGGALEALIDARGSGKIGHIGITVHSAAVFEYALTLPWVETVMFPFNIVESQGIELIRKCIELNIGFIAMKPLAGGAIENSDLALRYVLSEPAVSVVIPGISELKELQMNIASCENNTPLSSEEMLDIENIKNNLGDKFCRRCNYCAPCAAGISIPNVFLFAGYLERYNLENWARERYSSLAVKAGACIDCGQCEPRCPYGLPIRSMLKKCAAEFGE